MTEIGHDFLLDLLQIGFLIYTVLVVGHFGLQTLYAHRAWRRGLAASVGEAGRPPFMPGVDVIVTSYQEDPDRLAACLSALSGQDYEGPLGVYVVDDGSPSRGELMPIYERFERQAGWRVLLLERNVGKRHAQARAYGRSNRELVVTIDSDTEVASDGIRTIVTAFRDNSVGAVTGNVGVSNATHNLLTRLIGFRYWIAFNQERAAQGFFRTVLCCSGPFSVYRRSVLDVVWKRYTDQTFRGIPCTYGDDRHLTNLVLGAGFDALYEPRAHALTNAPTGLAEYLKQQLRWNKSFYRELLWTYPFLLQRSWFTTFDVVAQTLLPFLLTVAIASATLTAILVDPIRSASYAGTIVVMSLLRIVYALFRTRNSRFVLFTLYGFLHAAVLMPVRLRALATLTDNRWGTRAATPARGAGPPMSSRSTTYTAESYTVSGLIMNRGSFAIHLWAATRALFGHGGAFRVTTKRGSSSITWRLVVPNLAVVAVIAVAVAIDLIAERTHSVVNNVAFALGSAYVVGCIVVFAWCQARVVAMRDGLAERSAEVGPPRLARVPSQPAPALVTTMLKAPSARRRPKPAFRFGAAALLLAVAVPTFAYWATRDEPSVGRPDDPQLTAAGKEVIYGFLDRHSKRNAEGLLRDEYRLAGYRSVRIPRVSWQEDPFGEAYWRLFFYSLRPTGELLAAYNATGDERYRDKLLEHLRDYTAHDRRRRQRGLDRTRLDYPYSAAFRAMVLVNAYKKLDRIGQLPADLRRDLTWSIERLGSFLNDPRNFEPDNSRGFAEATALLLIAENFPRFEGAPVWRRAVGGRLSELMDHAVDEGGVQIERSPIHHFYVLRLATELINWAGEHGITLPKGFSRRADAMVRFATYVTLPDGNLPLQGSTVDTDVAKLDPQVFDRLGRRHPEFEYVRTAGLAGRQPGERLALFESSGDAFLRSDFAGPNEFDRPTHVAFNVGPHRTRNAHHDALHLSYYSAGRSLLPDSGLFTYRPGDEVDFFTGTRAHNTVVVDGRDQPKGPVSQGLAATGRDWTYMSGAHSLYRGVTHRRSVVVLRRDLALVVDGLSSLSAHTYDQTWHLLPGVELRRRGLDVTAVARDGRPLVALHQAAPRGTRLTDRIGERAPLQGWYSERLGRKQPNHALEYRVQARDARFGTLIASGRLAGAPAQVSLAETSGGVRATVCAGDTRRSIDIARPGEPGERVAVALAPASQCRG